MTNTTSKPAAHTPGPWQVREYLNRWNVTTCDKPRTFNIAAINTDRVEQEANARLIAAAPDLLAALKMARDTLAAIRKHPKNPWKGQEGEGVPIEAFCDVAIAKAEGR